MNFAMRLDAQLRSLHRAAADALARWSAAPPGRGAFDDPAPLRAELFSVEQMEQHGRVLAAAHVVDGAGARERLLQRLADNQRVLIAARELLTAAVKARRPIAPAGEWLLDNYYLIDDQMRTARRHLPRGYSRELPRLAQGASRGLPRVYDLALAAIAHGDGRVDAETLQRFIAAYQTRVVLKLGELWAIPIMLRLALIENLRRVGARITAARIDLNLAQEWASRMLEVAARDPKSLILVTADMARSDPPMSGAFVAEIARRLQGQGPALSLPLTWIEQRLAESSRSVEWMVLSENQQQAADQVSISNTIGSLRFLGAMDWRIFVESLSAVEQILLQDSGAPGATYAAMDFATRDRYRQVIDRLAKRSRWSEGDIAGAALALAQRRDARSSSDADRDVAERSDPATHVGYYLIDRGRRELELAIAMRSSAADQVRRLAQRAPLVLHLGGLLLLSAGFGGALLLQAQQHGVGPWHLVLLAPWVLLAASVLASALTNWLATLLATPQPLPRMDYARGLPADMRTLVAIPTLLSGAQDIDELLEAIEVRFLGNRDRHLHFALLTDFADAPKQTLAEDRALLQQVHDGVERLNKQYHERGDDRFLLLHRPRRWNAAEGLWMGYERKRGKLAELNEVLRGRGHDRYSRIVGDVDALRNVRFVITLDTDTALPRDSARQLVAAMAHPLNRPRYDAQRGCVCGGYGILQPRMAASLSGAGRSRYAQLYGSEPGIDPYTRAVSDVYQDLYGEGSFIGKGIYDVDAFERALKDRFPENRILSHDLLEGCYARSGLLSDVHLFEAYPSRYQADVQRQQRWIRGDWQIAHWLLPRVPGADGRALRNPLSSLSRWKIFDNLRRSLTPAAMVALLLLGWCTLPQPWLWTLAALAIVLLPPALIASVALLRKPRDLRWLQHLIAVLQGTAQNLAQVGFRFACLPYEAAYSLSAIARTAWRMLIAHRGLLEWRVSASDASGVAGADGWLASYRRMWVAPLTALIALALVAADAEALAAAMPVLILWLAAPALAAWLSQPRLRREARLSAEQTLFLRRIARKTWAFFERYVGPEDRWLPPDNFQQLPGPLLAHRTSPTNIGLSLLANLAAHDFGYIAAGALLQRTTHTFDTLALLERHQGHFYNWYDTQTLLPLPPRYVSSVDSGNLAGHLLTLRAGLLALPDQAIIAPRLFEGLFDTLTALAEAASELDQAPLLRLKALLNNACALRPASLPAVLHSLEPIVGCAARLSADLAPEPGSIAADWIVAFARHCEDALVELRELVPWLGVQPAPEGGPGLSGLDDIPTLRELANCAARLYSQSDALVPASDEQSQWLKQSRELIELGSARAAARIAACERLALQAGALATMDYEFLYDRTRHLLAIGYNVDEFRRDASFYDLLASEARQTCFVAIAQGQLPQESWFALGRLRTAAGGPPILVSWSGSMFEYLMPLLVMPNYEGTLLEQTCRAAVARQIAHGQRLGLPWGVSESGYNSVDAGLNYQYHAFGVPGLGLKRGLAEDAVVAPYASALALMVAPEAACANMQRLSAEGLEGRYGHYEAIDYTASRLPRGEVSSVVVRSFMAHHQGMSLLALAHLLLDRPMQRRFESDPLFQATLLLLQERIPKHAAIQTQVTDPAERGLFADAAETSAQAPVGAITPTPEVQLLSNGRYHVMLTNAGGGYSRWTDLALTRWREDSTCDDWGTFLYLRDADSGECWSAAHQPTLKAADSYEAMFSEGRAEIRQRRRGIETYTEVVVSPEDDIELRRMRITNRSRARRTLQLTSYAEVVLATPAADATQPAFGKLFVQTELVAERRAILCTRRPRSAGERTPWMFHLLAANGTDLGAVSYETDRLRFIGRGCDLSAPQALSAEALSGSAGSVLDAVVAIRCCIVLEAEQSVTLDWVWGAAESREACMTLVDQYQDRHRADRVFDLAWTHGGVTLRQINATETDARLYRRLAGPVLYANPTLRAVPGVLMQNRRGQSGLWGYAISGDLPIVLLKIADGAHIDLARQMIQCHAYWRLKGLVVDLVIWNEDHVGYRQRLQDQILGLIATGTEAQAIDRPGGIFVRSAEQISQEDRILLQAVARVIVADSRGTLFEQMSRRVVADTSIARLVPTRSHRPEPAAAADLPQDLILANDRGGFSADGSEYRIATAQAQRTPLPWVNVLANPHFGSVVTESAQAYTWSENAHEFRLTPWSDDAVGASGGEAFYLRDEESGHFWSPTPLPSSGAMPYLTRHGFGYSVFEHTAGGIRSELWMYVDLEAAVKYSVLKVRNGSGRLRKLSATGYVEWVLGDLRAKSAMHVVTEIDAASGALFARNAYSTEFGGRVAFFDVDDPTRSLSGDRGEFLGRNGSIRRPDAMKRARLSGRVGAGLDPCAAIQIPFELADGQEREIIFRLGAGVDLAQARKLAQRLRIAGSARAALQRVRQYWTRTLTAVQIETPDAALNVLANGWLVYQTLACRLWARSGYYQSGGAYGFRDQLQDTMALLHTEPALLREHLLRSAERQYLEGDVQHWWHPPAGRGVRTRCSDDYLWLPLATCRYVLATGDRSVLDEPLHFLEGRALGADEESYYDLPGRSAQTESLYQHCVRAIEHGLRYGARGLPLIGSGDWNDGMNRVGILGRGESVWLGFFLYEVLSSFAELAQREGDASFAARCRTHAQQLRRNLDLHAWDGEWYRRAWFDDGTPLGSSVNAECMIDSIAQSWSVLSGAGEDARARQAMTALDRHLVDRELGLVRLLQPPFDHSEVDPGYIKGYVPGVRENGGQYTHAAVWAAMAYARLGDSRRAWELLRLINPVEHARSAQTVAIYKTEPYVVAADVYALPPHGGRGGWSWYTGSAGWLYRLIIESLLGLSLEDGGLRIAPCLPEDWTTVTMRYRYRETTYSIVVQQRPAAAGVQTTAVLSLDDVVQVDGLIPLQDDRREHRVDLHIARSPETSVPAAQPASLSAAAPQAEPGSRST